MPTRPGNVGLLPPAGCQYSRLVPEHALLRPDSKNLTPKTKALIDLFFPTLTLSKKSESDVMTTKADTVEVRGFWSRLRRPRLYAGVTTGIAVYVMLLFVSSMSARLRFILAWDIGVLVALVAMFIGLRKASPDRMRTIAARQIIGKWTVLALTVFAATASLVAIAAEVPLIKIATELEQSARVTLVVVTILLSWALINTIFALHYAHDYYSRGTAAGEGQTTQEKCLLFPGTRPPSYGDFIYFSFTIGMTFQVSDVQIADPAVRRLAIAHGIISFFYTTVILALTVNLVAGIL